MVGPPRTGERGRGERHHTKITSKNMCANVAVLEATRAYTDTNSHYIYIFIYIFRYVYVPTPSIQSFVFMLFIRSSCCSVALFETKFSD